MAEQAIKTVRAHATYSGMISAAATLAKAQVYGHGACARGSTCRHAGDTKVDDNKKERKKGYWHATGILNLKKWEDYLSSEGKGRDGQGGLSAKLATRVCWEQGDLGLFWEASE